MYKMFNKCFIYTYFSLYYFREQFTLDLLSKFQKKLASAKEKVSEKNEDNDVKSDSVEDPDADDVNSDNW